MVYYVIIHVQTFKTFTPPHMLTDIIHVMHEPEASLQFRKTIGKYLRPVWNMYRI